MVLAWNLEQYLNLTRETQQCQKNLVVTSRRQIMTSSSLLQKMADLEQSRARIPKAWSISPTFSLIETFYLTKTENRTKKFVIQLSYYCFWLKVLFCQKMAFFCKKKKKKEANISKINEILVGKKVYFLKLNICVYLSTKFKVSSITLTRFRFLNFDDFNILAADCNKFKLVLTESLSIKRDKLILNRTIKSYPLELFD